MIRTPKAPRRGRVTVGPVLGVREAVEAFASDPEYLDDLSNGVITPDGAARCRPGHRALAFILPDLTNVRGQIPRSNVVSIGYENFVVIGHHLVKFQYQQGSALLGVHNEYALPNPNGDPIYGATVYGYSPQQPAYLTRFRNTVIVTQYNGMLMYQFDPVGSTFTRIPFTGTVAAPPTVYADRLFVVTFQGSPASTTLLWSEPSNATRGYNQPPDGGAVPPNPGYDNAWTLAQTSGEPITAIVGTNEGLIYFRRNSIGRVTGLVDEFFSTSAVHDSISQTIGTASPRAVVLTDGNVLTFVDQRGRPTRVRPGGDAEPLWESCRRTQKSLSDDPNYLKWAWGCYDPDTDLVLLGMPEVGPFVHDEILDTDIFSVLTFDRGSGRFHGTWMLQDEALAYGVGVGGVMGPPVFFYGTKLGAVVGARPLNDVGLKSGADVLDTSLGGTHTSVAFSLTTAPLLYQRREEAVAEEATINVRLSDEDVPAEFAVFATDSLGNQEFATLAVAPDAAGAKLADARATWGLATTRGRWFQLQVATVPYVEEAPAARPYYRDEVLSVGLEASGVEPPERKP